MFIPGLNRRVGRSTSNELDELADLLYEAELKFNLKPQQLLIQPEQDNWQYNILREQNRHTKNRHKMSPGPSWVCCSFVCEMWRTGGLYGSMGDQINCREQTNIDIHEMSWLDAHRSNQLIGKYQIHLNQPNRNKPYPHMNERCERQNPNYEKRFDTLAQDNNPKINQQC